MTFTLSDDKWSAADEIQNVGFALQRDGIEGAVTVTVFLGQVFAEPCTPDETVELDRSASGLTGWLAAHPELKAAEAIEAAIGGQPALQLDVTADVPPSCAEGPRIWLWVLPVVGDFHLDENEAARFIAADVGDTTMVVVIETFDPGQQAALLEAIQPVLDSMTIEP